MDSLRLVLGVKLGDGHVHGRLGDGVARGGIDLVLIGEVKVGEAGGQRDHLLGLTLEDLRHKDVYEVDLADNVDIKRLLEVFLEFLRFMFSPGHRLSQGPSSNRDRSKHLQVT